jgi:hypothetical protein
MLIASVVLASLVACFFLGVLAWRLTLRWNYDQAVDVWIRSRHHRGREWETHYIEPDMGWMLFCFTLPAVVIPILLVRHIAQKEVRRAVNRKHQLEQERDERREAMREVEKGLV